MAETKKGEKRKSSESDDEEIPGTSAMVDDKLKKRKAIFAKQDPTLVVEGHELHIDKTELLEKSPVFKTMLTSDFKEKDARRIDLPQQNLNDFVIFLRCTLSAIGDEINESNVWTLIPIANEYQVETTLSQAEQVLIGQCTRLGTDKQSSEDIIKGIVFAEKYNLNIYLQNLIDCASKKMFCFFSRANGYKDISHDTLFKIAMKRWAGNIDPIKGTAKTVNPADGTYTIVKQTFPVATTQIHRVPKSVM